MDNLNLLGEILFQEFLNPAVLIFSSAAFVWFLYGVMKYYLAKAKNKEEDLETGKKHMLWGLIGVLIIYSAGSIFNFLYSLFL